MATILDNMPIYMWFQLITNVLLLKFTLTQALKKIYSKMIPNLTGITRNYVAILKFKMAAVKVHFWLGTDPQKFW